MQSRVLAMPLVQQLGVLDIMKSTCELLWPLYSSWELPPDDLVALESAITAVRQATENDHTIQPDQLMRSNPEQGGDLNTTVEMLLGRFDFIECV
jgi:hypothetical protein